MKNPFNLNLQTKPSFILFSYLISLLPLIFCENYLEWEDKESGSYYDLSAIKRSFNNPWVHKKDSGAFSDIYRFNFNDNVNHQCYGKSGSIIESFEIQNQAAASCSILGDYRNRKVQMINRNNPNEGILMEYTGVEVCMHSFVGNHSTMRSVKFYIFCAENQEENFSRYYGDGIRNQACVVGFSIKTPAGCVNSGIRIFKDAKVFLFYVCACFLIYFSLGFFYKSKYKDLHGKEAIPNIEFWRDLPSLVVVIITLKVSPFKVLIQVLFIP